MKNTKNKQGGNHTQGEWNVKYSEKIPNIYADEIQLLTEHKKMKAIIQLFIRELTEAKRDGDLSIRETGILETLKKLKL